MADTDDVRTFRDITNRDSSALSTYLADGANLNVHDADGMTLLIAAIAYGDQQQIAAVLGAGADPNTTGDEHVQRQASPLAVALDTRNLAAVATLLAAGADPTAVDADGNSILDDAEVAADYSGNQEFVDVVLRAIEANYAKQRRSLDGRPALISRATLRLRVDRCLAAMRSQMAQYVAGVIPDDCVFAIATGDQSSVHVDRKMLVDPDSFVDLLSAGYSCPTNVGLILHGIADNKAVIVAYPRGDKIDLRDVQAVGRVFLTYVSRIEGGQGDVVRNYSPFWFMAPEPPDGWLVYATNPNVPTSRLRKPDFPTSLTQHGPFNLKEIT